MNKKMKHDTEFAWAECSSRGHGRYLLWYRWKETCHRPGGYHMAKICSDELCARLGIRRRGYNEIENGWGMIIDDANSAAKIDGILAEIMQA